jgi:hypothetical protein
MAIHIERREFIALVGGTAAAAWPLTARAQQGEQVRRVGVLVNLPADDPEASARVTAFAQGLQQLGWTVGRNVRVDYRWGTMDADRSRRPSFIGKFIDDGFEGTFKNGDCVWKMLLKRAK